MRYAQFDYHPALGQADIMDMQEWWASHWNERKGWKEDLRDEALWPTIVDVLKEPGVLLEAGCGPGQWVQFFDRLGHTTIGVDYAHAALRRGKTLNSQLRLLSGDLRTLPFADRFFDYIFSHGAVEHDIAGPEAALKEFHRVLKPTGWMMCAVPCLNIERQVGLPWFHVRDWLKRQPMLRRLAKKTDSFEFYQYLYSPAAYIQVLKKCEFSVFALRPYGLAYENALSRSLAHALSNISEFYNPHMMMAICRKMD